MRRPALIALIALFSAPVQADTLLAARTLRAGTAISAADVVLVPDAAAPGIASDPEEAIGLESRVTLYAGRPIPLASLGPPALVERNQLVTLVFQQGGLDIRAEGRALARGGDGDEIRIMNLGSRSTVFGTVAGPGLVTVP
ncbi:flagellar basal body P-ring formation chaperone FlgA [Pararhodobacter oceanensis]|uniref:flagellar basal body P-ring formation chaperone FlgA n=1 Tax=Pararhodobacter oceanensis TaxID=2172121 RepID=UPI003A959941